MSGILIVDDSAVMRRNLRMILENAGFEVVGEAANGQKAYTFYKEFMPELVTMDIAMPDIDGVTVTRNILEEYPEAKIVVVSSLAQKAMVYDALKNGAKNYLIKPIDPTKLVKIVNDVINEGVAERICPVSVSNVPEDIDKIQEDSTETDNVFSVEEYGSHGFKVKVTSKLNDFNYPVIAATLDVMLMIEPSNILFDFTGKLNCRKGVESIVEVIKRLKKSDTEVSVSCRESNEELIKFLKNNGIECTVN